MQDADAELLQVVLDPTLEPQATPEPEAAPEAVPIDSRRPEPVADDAAALAVGAEVRKSGSWLWARFPSRPSAEVREQMKAAGWRWSRRRGAWYLRPAQVAA